MADGAEEPRRRAAKKDGLPHNWEIERALLGGCIQCSSLVPELVEIVRAEDFSRPQHQALYALLTASAAAGRLLDINTLSDEIAQRGDFETYGGAAYVFALPPACPTVELLPQYARRVRDLADRRRLLIALQEQVALVREAIPRRGEENLPTPADLCDQASAAVQLVRDGAAREATWTALPPVVDAVTAQVQAAHADPGRIRGVITGYSDVDTMIGGLEAGRVYVLAARPGMGKAQPLDAKILTPSGWTTMGALRVGDLVVGSDGQPIAVRAIHEQGERDVHRVVMTDGAATECCDEHLWLTETRNERRFGRAPSPKSLADIRATLQIEHGKRFNHRLPLVAPVVYSTDPMLPMHPYLLGCLLGDGGLTSATAYFHKPEGDLQGRVVSLLPGGDRGVPVGNGTGLRIVRSERRGGQPSATMQIIRDLGLAGLKSHEKFIPDAYLYAPVDARRELLRGLLDTDGSVLGGGVAVEYSSSSPRLAADVRQLVWSLGGLCTSSSRQPRYSYRGETRVGRMSWRMVVTFPSGWIPVSTEKNLAKWAAGTTNRRLRHVERIEPAGRKVCRCIEVDAPDHLYVTDDFILTHNTSKALGIATGAANRGNRVGIFSMEMGREQITGQLIAQHARVELRKMMEGRGDSDDIRRWLEASERVAALPIVIDDAANLPVSEIRSRARAMKRDGGLGLVVVDYLQLATCPEARRGGREQEVSAVSRGLLGLAKDIGVPVLALAQLNRNLEQRSDKRPTPSDLRESGSIEGDAHAIMFIYRDEVYNPDSPDRGLAEIIIAKNRSGPTGVAKLAFMPQFTLFQNYAAPDNGTDRGSYY